jgi:hypothetical protein
MKPFECLSRFSRYGTVQQVMSASEIIAELPKLDRRELELVNASVEALLQPAPEQPTPRQTPIGQVLLEFAGRAEGLPPDYSANLDHYLYAVPKAPR